MADLGIRRDRLDDAPAGHPEDDILQQPGFGVCRVEALGDGAIGRAVDRVVGVEEVERNPPDLGLPYPERDLAPG